MQRSYKQIYTLEGKILRYMRLARGLSMRKAGALVDLSDSAICHYEHGRMDLNPRKIRLFVAAYGFTMGEFNEFLAGNKPVPENLRDDCINLLNRIQDPVKLKAVHTILQGFTV